MACFRPMASTPQSSHAIITKRLQAMLNHMGMYAGQLAGIHYILHLLLLDHATTGMGGVGMLHFERVTTTIGRVIPAAGPFRLDNEPRCCRWPTAGSRNRVTGPLLCFFIGVG